MTDITAASALSSVFRQTSVDASHDAYGAARSGHSHASQSVDKVNSTSSSDFDSTGSFLRSAKASGTTSPLSQIMSFLA